MTTTEPTAGGLDEPSPASLASPTPTDAHQSAAAAGIDPQRWPDVARTPRDRIRAAIARTLVRHSAARLPLRMQLPDGEVLGTATAPVMVIRRPEAFYRRLGASGLVGFGEAYQAGDWESDDLPGLLAIFARHVESIVPRQLQWLRHLHGPRHPRAEENTVDGARENIHRHYDLSNDLFALFLDESMAYSAALFDEDRAGQPTGDLTPAQHRKIDRLLDLTRVGPDSRVLEIGTGWGELAIRAAQRGATVDTITISVEQRELALRRAAAAGVADRVRVDLRDYRDVVAPGAGYDAVVSVEMIEAVGERYWPTYFAAIDRLLAPHGRAGIQAITMAHERLLATRRSYTWMHKYIFPGGIIPSVRSIEETCRRHTNLRLRHLHAFGSHYARTLKLWRERFLQRATDVSALGFDETFKRTWNLYLAYCEAGFATGYLDVHHLVLDRSR